MHSTCIVSMHHNQHRKVAATLNMHKTGLFYNYSDWNMNVYHKINFYKWDEHGLNTVKHPTLSILQLSSPYPHKLNTARPTKGHNAWPQKVNKNQCRSFTDNQGDTVEIITPFLPQIYYPSRSIIPRGRCSSNRVHHHPILQVKVWPGVIICLRRMASL